jgi:uncharacterized protein (DUF2147 family)
MGARRGEETVLRRFLLALTALRASSHFALAGDILGEWARDDGKGKVRFIPCGAAVCGSVTWVRDADDPAKVGEQVFFDMKPSGPNVGAAMAFNPEDGQNYTGKMTMSGNGLITAGCIFGGWICKTVAWTKSR